MNFIRRARGRTWRGRGRAAEEIQNTAPTEHPLRAIERERAAAQARRNQPPSSESDTDFPPLGTEPPPNNTYRYPAPEGYRSFGNQLKGEWRNGLVVIVPHHVPDFEFDNHEPNPTKRVLSAMGSYVYSKSRRMIVIQTFTHHCVLLPLYTYNTLGLLGKRDEYMVEHIGVRDINSSDEEKNNTEAPYANIMVRRLPEGTGGRMLPNTYCLFTQPVSFGYEVPCLIHGEVGSSDDYNRLVAHYFTRSPYRYGIPHLIDLQKDWELELARRQARNVGMELEWVIGRLGQLPLGTISQQEIEALQILGPHPSSFKFAKPTQFQGF